MKKKETRKVTNWIIGLMLRVKYTQNMKIAQMYKKINMAFYV